MDETTRAEMQAILELLKSCMIKNSVSMATDEGGNIYFFDTDTFVKSKKMSGFQVNIDDLVK